MKTLLALLVAVAPALAESQAQIAAKANDEGKALMFDSKFEAAAKKFQDAAARDPQAKYFFNLCTADFQLGKLGEALSACDAVGSHNPDATVKDKAQKMIVRIKDEAQRQNIKLK